MGTEIGTIIEMDNSWKFHFFVTVIKDKTVLRNCFNENLYITFSQLFQVSLLLKSFVNA